mmetsp:Transcript_105848/g.331098  ORF Transcript_105848/g.331098 Transcript_105848/m.331098 type:complete len:256 (-) Transcript_105848:349-1116(-)
MGASGALRRPASAAHEEALRDEGPARQVAEVLRGAGDDAPEALLNAHLLALAQAPERRAQGVPAHEPCARHAPHVSSARLPGLRRADGPHRHEEVAGRHGAPDIEAAGGSAPAMHLGAWRSAAVMPEEPEGNGPWQEAREPVVEAQAQALCPWGALGGLHLQQEAPCRCLEAPHPEVAEQEVPRRSLRPHQRPEALLQAAAASAPQVGPPDAERPGFRAGHPHRRPHRGEPLVRHQTDRPPAALKPDGRLLECLR